MKTEDEMKRFFMKDMKNFKAPESGNLLRLVAWAIVAVVVLVGVTSKMGQDIESFKAEQAYKLERQ